MVKYGKVNYDLIFLFSKYNKKFSSCYSFILFVIVNIILFQVSFSSYTFICFIASALQSVLEITFSFMFCILSQDPPGMACAVLSEDMLPIFQSGQPQKLRYDRRSVEEIHIKTTTHHVIMTSCCNKCASVLTYDN